jgi:L-threonylcarbamoyladenylate synthase
MVISRKSSDSADCAAQFLREGRLVIIPTDTIYGFSGIVPGANALIIKAKGRDEGKPFIQLIARSKDLARYSDDTINPSLLALWPGAVTIIVRNKEGGTTAFRCPGDAWLRSVLEKTGAPVYSTSVNRAGEASLKKIGDIITQFGAIADLIVDDGDHPEAAASTIIDATGDVYRVIRQGAVQVHESALRRQ